MCEHIYIYIYACTNVLLFVFFFFFNICSFTSCLTGFRFIIISNVFSFLNWYCRTSAHVLPLVWQNCVPRSQRKQRLCGFVYLGAQLYTSIALELGLNVVTFLLLHLFFPYLLYIAVFSFVMFGVLETFWPSFKAQKTNLTLFITLILHDFPNFMKIAYTRNKIAY